jgi:hypothetical protein
MPYQIGVTLANMQNLEDLYVPDPVWDPLSDFTPWSELRTRGDGEIVGAGFPNFTWRFNELTIPQFGVLLQFVMDEASGELKASDVVYVQTRVPYPNMTDRYFRTYRARMLCPLEPRAARYSRNRKYENVEISFVQAVLQP